MKRAIIALLSVTGFLGVARGAPTLDESMQKAASEYREKAAVAAVSLNKTRARIADEKAPLLKELRDAEDRMVAAEAEVTQLETLRDNSADMRKQLFQDLEAVRKVTDYAETLARESLKADYATLAPGEDQRLAGREDELQKGLDEAAALGKSGSESMDVADFLLQRTQEALGGYRTEGML